MLPAQATDSKIHVLPVAARCGILQHPATLSRKIVNWRATVDEDGHYWFAVAL
jgi:hypothetical protein